MGSPKSSEQHTWGKRSTTLAKEYDSAPLDQTRLSRAHRHRTQCGPGEGAESGGSEATKASEPPRPDQGRQRKGAEAQRRRAPPPSSTVRPRRGRRERRERSDQSERATETGSRPPAEGCRSAAEAGPTAIKDRVRPRRGRRERRERSDQSERATETGSRPPAEGCRSAAEAGPTAIKHSVCNRLDPTKKTHTLPAKSGPGEGAESGGSEATKASEPPRPDKGRQRKGAEAQRRRAPPPISRVCATA